MRRVTAGCLFLALLTWVGAFHVDRLQELDARLLAQLNRLDGTLVEDVVELCSGLIDPLPYLVLCAAMLVAGWRAAGARAAFAAAVCLAGANVTTQLLKRWLAEPRHSEVLADQVGAVSWPSGHATAAASALLAALILAPPRRRPAVLAFGVPWAAIVCVGVVVNHWHFPSDAFAGMLVAGAWASAAAAWVSSSRPAPAATAARRPRWRRATG